MNGIAPGILIVDDEIIIARDLEVRLGNLGYDIRGIACSGEEAIRLAEKTQPNLVLMDIVLKGDMDGIEAAAEISKRWGFPVIYLSAYADEATLKRARITEPFGYLVKPFSERELRANIEMALYKHESESKLRRVEKWFVASVERVAEGVVTTDRKGIVTFLNAEAEAMLGRSSLDTIGRALQDVVPLRTTAASNPIADIFNRTFIEGVVIHLEEDTLRLEAKEGPIPVELTSGCIRDDNGKAMGVVLVLRDQSERRRLQHDLRESEEELRRKNAMLAEANRRKDEFLAMLAHELRNPLAPIRNALEVMRRICPSSDSCERMRMVADRQVNHLACMVDDLLDASRITRGNVRLQKKVLELAGAVNHAVETVRPQIEAHQHRLTVKLPPEPIRLEADPVRLEQVLVNFLNNAVKFTPVGGEISLTVQRKGSEAVIRVHDSGAGISAELLSHIFDLFTQAPQSLDRSNGGLGIGLALVKKLIEMHGGKVEAHSDGPDQGSEFVIHLPILP